MSGDRTIAQFVEQAVTVRDRASELANESRKLVRLAKALGVSPEKPAPRTRGRYRNALRHRSLALAALGAGMTAGDLAARLSVPATRIGALFQGAKPTDAEREALQRLLPTWVE